MGDDLGAPEPAPLIPTSWTAQAEIAAYEALADLAWSEWSEHRRPFLHGQECVDYGPGL